jgi:putative RNA 2'-phosphotransferase
MGIRCGRTCPISKMLTEKETIKLSKFLSLVLRHRPELIGIVLDDQGWVAVAELRKKAATFGNLFSLAELAYVVETNNKKRFAFNGDRRKIRASQGHSIDVDLGYEPQMPPEILYHGTTTGHIESILKSGLHKRNRTHVHPSFDQETAIKVGRRHGNPVVFEVAAGSMRKSGHLFYLSGNGVWLTDKVPKEYLTVKF